MSWDELEAIGQAKDIRNVDQHRKDTDRLYLRVFGTEDGAKLMKYFCMSLRLLFGSTIVDMSKPEVLRSFIMHSL
jgi:hypothetical protein